MGVPPIRSAFHTHRPLDVAQALALIAIALIPLIPRPTFGGYVAILAPAVGGVAAYLGVLQSLTARRSRLIPVLPLYLVTLATTLYGARVVWDSEWSELLYFASRVLFILTIVACCVSINGNGFEAGLRWFIYVTLALSALVLLVGLTGLDVLEPARPGRLLGIQIPFFKTAGVPRSFGEQGIVLALMLGYFLAYRQLMPRWLRWALGFSCVVVIVMAQSRNVLLCAVAMSVMWLAVVHRRWVLVRIGLVAAGLATFVMDQIIPLLQDTLIGQALIGQGVFHRNVEARFTLVYGALTMIAANPVRSLIGWSHAQWAMYSPLASQTSGLVVHNHFVSSIMFLGIIGGSLTILALYVLPLRNVVTSLEKLNSESIEARRRRFAVVSSTGALICVNFYEGFFSLALALQIGILWTLMVATDEEVARTAEPPAPWQRAEMTVRVSLPRSSKGRSLAELRTNRPFADRAVTEMRNHPPSRRLGPRPTLDSNDRRLD